jgi:drug/metabolite transporter (DMT)-like permease
MIVVAMLRGEHLNGLEWAGVIIAMAGLVYLLLPGAGAPTLGGFLLMAAAGVAWGFYTLFGRGSSHAMADTSWNFIRSVPLALVMIAFWLFAEGGWHVTGTGVLLAVLSGALASGLGYTAWYLALAGLGISQAAVLQLLVPV